MSEQAGGGTSDIVSSGSRRPATRQEGSGCGAASVPPAARAATRGVQAAAKPAQPRGGAAASPAAASPDRPRLSTHGKRKRVSSPWAMLCCAAFALCLLNPG